MRNNSTALKAASLVALLDTFPYPTAATRTLTFSVGAILLLSEVISHKPPPPLGVPTSRSPHFPDSTCPSSSIAESLQSCISGISALIWAPPYHLLQELLILPDQPAGIQSTEHPWLKSSWWCSLEVVTACEKLPPPVTALSWKTQAPLASSQSSQWCPHDPFRNGAASHRLILASHVLCNTT